jgi:nitrate reductase molybdenum cofactor assembly chaperone NarJ/NarW
VLPGVERLHAAFAARQDSPWKTLVEAARLLCAADCKEVPSC